MTPIFMVKDGASRYDGRNDGLREYLRTEYGSSNVAWLIADGRFEDTKPSKAGSTGRLRTWLGKHLHVSSPKHTDVEFVGL